MFLFSVIAVLHDIEGNMKESFTTDLPKLCPCYIFLPQSHDVETLTSKHDFTVNNPFFLQFIDFIFGFLFLLQWQRSVCGRWAYISLRAILLSSKQALGTPWILSSRPVCQSMEMGHRNDSSPQRICQP